MAQAYKPDWEGYWKHPYMTSLMARGDKHYDLEIYDFWNRVLARDATQIIDLACGNGALSFLADSIVNRPQAGVRITGIDYASINPFKRLKRKKAAHRKVDFLPNTALESLPLADASADMAISQWGLEYADIERAIPEVGRVLRPRASLALVCHHQGSDLVRRNTRALEGMRLLLGEGEIFDAFLALDAFDNTRLSTGGSAEQPERQNILGGLNRRIYEIRPQLAANERFDGKQHLAELTALFAKSQPIHNPQRKPRILALREDLEHAIGRIEHLLEAALSPEELDRLAVLIEAEGFSIAERFPLRYSDVGEVGTAFVAHRG